MLFFYNVNLLFQFTLKTCINQCNAVLFYLQLAESRPLVSLEVHRGTICGRGVEILSANDPQVTSSAMMAFMAKAEELMIQQEESDAMDTSESEGIKITTTRPLDQCCEVQEKSSAGEESCQGIVPVHSIESQALQTSMNPQPLDLCGEVQEWHMMNRVRSKETA